ncbi:nucleoside 2-deoxyribosyltransferase [Streptomyces sp. NPDC059708]|uniref:nucleoside 2-deoxyribosyltransferase n=1 Tax=Streptomyces sp. NPDC059708 TaxID=3346916 RepID=UPI0036924379
MKSPYGTRSSSAWPPWYGPISAKPYAAPAIVVDVKGLRLYELDTRRLATLTGMIAVLRGPSLDDGMCMEIGYATALGLPVIILTTDFQTYDPKGAGPAWEFPDPLVETVAHRIVHVSALGSPTTESSSRFAAFRDRNENQITTAIEEAVDTVLAAPTANALGTVTRHGVFVEPSPYATHPGLTAAVHASGHTVRTAARLTGTHPLADATPDLAQAEAATHLVVDASGPETPPGAALLIGAAAARQQPVIAYQPQPVYTHAHGREPNWRNLMIQYASARHATTCADVTR